MWNESGQGRICQVVADGIRQSVLLAGIDPPSSGTVLLIHGLGWDHTLWRGQVGPLLANGWKVVAPDLRGMGANLAAQLGMPKRRQRLQI